MKSKTFVVNWRGVTYSLTLGIFPFVWEYEQIPYGKVNQISKGMDLMSRTNTLEMLQSRKIKMLETLIEKARDPAEKDKLIQALMKEINKQV